MLGTFTFRYLSEDAIRVLIGVIAVGFVAHTSWAFLRSAPPPARRAPRPLAGTFWGAMAGFTSFGVHAGGPPTNVPTCFAQGLDKGTFQATTVLFFMIMGWVKVPPYALLGQFDYGNLATSLALAPLAPLGIRLGRGCTIRSMKPGSFASSTPHS